MTGLEKTIRSIHVRGHLYFVRFCDEPQQGPVFAPKEYYERVRLLLQCLGICSNIIIQAIKLSPDRHSFI